MPIQATELRIFEIKNELEKGVSNVILNGLFLMLVSYLESMQKEIISYYLKYQPEKILINPIKLDRDILLENEDFYLLESILKTHIEKSHIGNCQKYFMMLSELKNQETKMKFRK